MKNLYHLIITLFALFFLAACSNTKYLQEGESLYKGPKVKIIDSTNTTISKKQKKALETELATYVRPLPNRKILGLKARLWVWNVVGTPKKEKGIKHWLRTKFGEPPVLASDVRLEMNNMVLEDQMFNKGFFQSSSLAEKIEKKKRTTAYFEVLAGPQYLYKTIEYMPGDSMGISQIIRDEQANSLIKIGEPYNLTTIIAERDRLGKVLTNKGYYFFNSDYLLAVVDTNKEAKQEVNMKIILKDEIMPKAAFQSFRINNILVLPNYRIQSNTNNKRVRQGRASDTVVSENYTIVDPWHSVRDVVFRESIQFEKGETYSEVEQNRTLNRIVGSGLFKFVRSDFMVVRDSSTYTGSLFDIAYNTLLQRGIIASPNPRLDVTYFLTQYPKKKINLEYGIYTLNDARVGNRLNLSWRNRNFFKGAEIFSTRAVGGFEMQYGGQNQRPNTYNIGGEVGLSAPRFLIPFVKIKTTSAFLPKTTLTAKYDFFLRSGLYRIHSGSLGFGYVWKEVATKEHKLTPINITYVKTDTFDFTNDIKFQNILFNGLILGPTYEFTYNSQIGARKKHEFYFNGLADLSGNVLGLIQKADYETNPEKVFGNAYAQYVKVQADFRYYLNLSANQNIATRAFVGYGLPYGNSKILPNVKQLFSGGISSVRGFNARMIGPGTYNERYLTGANTYIEMLGDIKIETNIEYRSKLWDFIHGAVFVDAGNVWLRNERPEFPGGKFTSSFYKEMAAGAGFGLRFDFSVLMLRLDVGIPVRKPWMPEGERWVFNKINFGSDVWRRENIVFGFAIGYPF